MAVFNCRLGARACLSAALLDWTRHGGTFACDNVAPCIRHLFPFEITAM